MSSTVFSNISNNVRIQYKKHLNFCHLACTFYPLQLILQQGQTNHNLISQPTGQVKTLMCLPNSLGSILHLTKYFKLVWQASQLVKCIKGPFNLVLKCILGDQVTGGRPRHTAVYTCAYLVSPRCLADHLCSDYFTAYITFPRRSKVPMNLFIDGCGIMHNNLSNT